MSVGHKKAWQDPERRKKRSSEMKELWQDHTFRERMCAIRQDPAYQEKQRVDAKKWWQDPTHRAKMSETIQEIWQDSEYRITQVASIQEARKDSEYRARQSLVTKKVWQNPAFRSTQSVAFKKRSKDPELRAKVSAAMSSRLKAGAFRKEDGFRSGWEKKVADWMTSQAWIWRYEEISYEVGNKNYTPDFHVYREGQLWKIVEVKGRWIGHAREKVDQFIQQYPHLPFEIWGKEKLRELKLL